MEAHLKKARETAALKKIQSAAKAQTEFYFLAGIVVVILVVAYTYISSTAPAGPTLPMQVQQNQNMVKDSVLKVIRDGLDLSVKELSMRGGFFEPGPGNSVVFSHVLVPYWQKCNETRVPSKQEIKAAIEGAVKNYIANSNLTGLYHNAVFRTEQMSVTAVISESNVRVGVFLPTSVDGYQVQQPYQTQVPTKLGRIIDFAADFVAENKAQRFFEWFTAGSLKQSETLPTEGILTECNEVVYISKEQQRQAYVDIIAYTLANTFWWVPLQPAPPGEPKTWAIQYVNSKQYKDLDIKFYLPDGFDITVSSPIRIVSNKYLINELFGFVFPHCLTPFQQLYSISYPVVFRIKDAPSSHFQFAIFVDMDRLSPGGCAGSAMTDECSSLGCHANMTVTHGGNPVSGAVVDYQGCIAGSTDSGGRLAAPIKCGTGMLEIFASGYEPFNTTVPSASINNTYSLIKAVEATLMLKKVDIAGGCNQLNINSSREWVTVSFERKSDGASNPYSNREFNESCIEECLVRFPGSGMEAEKRTCLMACLKNSYSGSMSASLLEGMYKITGTVMNAETNNYTGGFIVDNFLVREADAELNVFIPILAKEQSEITDDNRTQLTGTLTGCGFLSPVQRGR